MLPVGRGNVFLQPGLARLQGVGDEIPPDEVAHFLPVRAHPIDHIRARLHQCAELFLALMQGFPGAPPFRDVADQHHEPRVFPGRSGQAGNATVRPNHLAVFAQVADFAFETVAFSGQQAAGFGGDRLLVVRMNERRGPETVEFPLAVAQHGTECRIAMLVTAFRIRDGDAVGRFQKDRTEHIRVGRNGGSRWPGRSARGRQAWGLSGRHGAAGINPGFRVADPHDEGADGSNVSRLCGECESDSGPEQGNAPRNPESPHSGVGGFEPLGNQVGH